MKPIDDVRKLMLAKIAESGLSKADAKKLCLKPCLTPPPEIKIRGRGFVIPYFTSSGKQNGFYRYRYVDQIYVKDKLVRYSQPAGKAPEAYFSPLFPWAAHLAAHQGEERLLLLTEGENKSNAGAKHELPVIGLGGVSNYLTKGRLIDSLEAIDWQDTKAVIIYDSDAADNGNVALAENGLAALLLERGARVYIVRLPQLVSGAKTGLDDYLMAKGGTACLKLLKNAEEWQSSPRIFSSDPLHRAVEKAERILAHTPEYKLFTRGSGLVRVVEEQRDYKKQDVFQRPRGNTYLADVSAATVEFLLSAANCIFALDGKKGMKRAEPKAKWCTQVIERVTGFPEQVPWLRLNLVTSTPLLLADGSLVEHPGYHEATGVWLDPQGRVFPPIPDRPTKQEARQALDLFAQVFGKFPFASEADYAAVLATVLSVLFRHQLPTVPLLGVTAPEAGSGKTKIAEAIGGATTGCLLPRISFDNVEEFDKHLPCPLKAGDRIVLIDNVERKRLHSSRLDGALTTEAPFKWRTLGETEEQVFLNRSVFIATGNQLLLSGTLPRRSLLCRLDPNVEAPEARRFDFDPVVRAREMFPRLTMAVLTALRYYLQHKCPAPSYAKDTPWELGSFTEWNRVVRGLLVHLGFGDPLATQKEVRSEDPLRSNDIALVHELHMIFPHGEKFTINRITNNANNGEAFALLMGTDQRWNAEKAGLRLRGLRDRVLDGLKLESAGRLHGVAIYRVTELEVTKG